MATKGDGVRLVQVNAAELMAAGLAEVAVREAASALHAGGYPSPSEEAFTQIAFLVTQAALAMPHLVEDMAATTDAQLEEAARVLGASIVVELLGPAPKAC